MKFSRRRWRINTYLCLHIWMFIWIFKCARSVSVATNVLYLTRTQEDYRERGSVTVQRSGRELGYEVNRRYVHLRVRQTAYKSFLRLNNLCTQPWTREHNISFLLALSFPHSQSLFLHIQICNAICLCPLIFLYYIDGHRNIYHFVLR